MDPYKRFRLISNSLAVALVTLGVGLTTFAGGPAERLAGSLFGAAADGPLASPLTAVLMISLVVLVWLALSQYVLPRLFGFDVIRRLILGRYYFEGTWIKGVRLSDDRKALAILDIQPLEDGFCASGRFINERGEVTSNFRAEYQELAWPVIKLKHVHNRADQDNGARDGVAELMFEANRERAQRFDGCFIEGALEGALLEGSRLDDREARRLRTPGERAAVLSDYWTTFFTNEVHLNRKPSRALTPSRPAAKQGPSAVGGMGG